MLVYLSDVDECGGPTAVVPRDGKHDPAYQYDERLFHPGIGPHPWVNDAEAAEAYFETEHPETYEFRKEQLYRREVRVRYRVGTALLYRSDLWHRGTRVNEGALRVVHQIGASPHRLAPPFASGSGSCLAQ